MSLYRLYALQRDLTVLVGASRNSFGYDKQPTPIKKTNKQSYRRLWVS